MKDEAINPICLTVCIHRTDEDKYGGLTFEIKKAG